MPNWGPVQGQVGPGSTTPDTREIVVYDTGQIAVGSMVLLRGTVHTTFSGGRNDAVWWVKMRPYDASGHLIEDDLVVNQRLSAPDGTWTWNAPVVATRITVVWGTALYAGQTTFGTLSGSWDTRTPCEYGTELIDAGTFIYYLTPALIDTIATEAGALWLVPFFTALYFTTFNAQTLCGQGPPPIPVINYDTLSSSLETIKQLFAVIAWPHFCRCRSGAPPPSPYPPPSIPQPPGIAPAPTFPCDPAALCANITAIQQQLAALAQVVSSSYQLTTLVQRYGYPFAYISGAVHSEISGDGGFATSRLLGFQVTVTSRPADRPELRGNPPYVYNLGWLTVMSAGGVLQERRLSRDSFVWLPPGCQEATEFRWSLDPDIVIRVTELEAEP